MSDVKLCVDCATTLARCAALAKEKRELRARIAELEAAQRWHDASKPPEMLEHTSASFSRNVEVQYLNGNVSADCYDHHRKCWSNQYVARWRELPPMPERDEA